MIQLWIHYKPEPKTAVVSDLPWYAVVLERLVCTWPFYYWNREISRWFWHLQNKAPQVVFPLTDEQEKAIKRDLWGQNPDE